MRPESKHLCVCVCTHACVWLMTLSSSTLTELPFSSLGIALELLGYRVIIFIPYKKVEVSVNANQAFRLLLSGITFSKLKWKKKKKVKKVKWKSLSHIQLFVTPWTIQPTEFSRPEYWGVVFPFSRGSSQPKDQTQVSCIAGGFFVPCAA